MGESICDVSHQSAVVFAEYRTQLLVLCTKILNTLIVIRIGCAAALAPVRTIRRYRHADTA
ncbi:hypothetical protein D3C87_2207330 [compost metagenome]